MNQQQQPAVSPQDVMEPRSSSANPPAGNQGPQIENVQGQAVVQQPPAPLAVLPLPQNMDVEQNIIDDVLQLDGADNNEGAELERGVVRNNPEGPADPNMPGQPVNPGQQNGVQVGNPGPGQVGNPGAGGNPQNIPPRPAFGQPPLLVQGPHIGPQMALVLMPLPGPNNMPMPDPVQKENVPPTDYTGDQEPTQPIPEPRQYLGTLNSNDPRLNLPDI